MPHIPQSESSRRFSLVGGARSPSCASRAMPSSLVHAQHARASPSPLCPYCCQGLCAQAPRL